MKIQGHDGFVRDERTGAIINNDVNSYKLYKERRKKSREKDKKIQDLQQQVDKLEATLNEVIRHIKS
mgnify:CR=1 FL=1